MGKVSTSILLMILLLWVVFGILTAVLIPYFNWTYTNWLLTAPIFFSLFTVLNFKMVVLNPAVKVTALMASKTIRLLVTMAIILLYIVLVKENSILFVVTFGIYFVIDLIVETLIMVRMNRSKNASK